MGHIGVIVTVRLTLAWGCDKMIECPDIDLVTLADRFIECDDYTKDIILGELRHYQTLPDFLCITDGESFLIGHRNRDTLYLDQIYNHAGQGISGQGMEFIRAWAIDRGMTSITGETTRTQMKALSRYGFKECAIIIRIEL